MGTLRLWVPFKRKWVLSCYEYLSVLELIFLCLYVFGWGHTCSRGSLAVSSKSAARGSGVLRPSEPKSWGKESKSHWGVACRHCASQRLKLGLLETSYERDLRSSIREEDRRVGLVKAQQIFWVYLCSFNLGIGVLYELYYMSCKWVMYELYE